MLIVNEVSLQHILHFLGDIIDLRIPVLFDEVEDPAHDRPARQSAAEDQAPSATSPVTESTHSCNRKYWTVIAPPPISVTTAPINSTAHSRAERGGVISITTMVETNTPPAAAAPAAFNAAAPGDATTGCFWHDDSRMKKTAEGMCLGRSGG